MPKNFSKNISANNLRPSVTVYPIAVGEGEIFGDLHISSKEPGSSLHQFGANGAKVIPKHEHAPITRGHGTFMSTVDRLVREWGFADPNHIKIDVDGHEQHVLNGMKGILEATAEFCPPFPYAGNLKTVLAEVYDDDIAGMKSFMGLYGFREDTNYAHTSRQREKLRAETEGGRWAGAGNAIFVKG